VPLISAIGVSFFLQDAVRALEGLLNNAFYRNYPSFPILNQQIPIAAFTVAGEPVQMQIQAKVLFIIVASLLMLTGLNFVVNATRLGRAIRAVAQDRPTAALMGVNVDRIIMLTFLLGGALGGATGVLYGIRIGRIDPYLGFIPGIKAFTAAVLGGIGNITGAMLAGSSWGCWRALQGPISLSLPAAPSGRNIKTSCLHDPDPDPDVPPDRSARRASGSEGIM
jgi:branched-chain amino acid transport system permease protein